MSNKLEFMSQEEYDSNKEFLETHDGKNRLIKRKSRQARFTHDFTAIACGLLVLTGLFVFIKPLGELVGPNVVFVCRMSHRVIGVCFILVPIISGICSIKGVRHIISNLFAKWNEDDKKWMLLFIPYLFLAKYLHMPDQDEVKSGQRFADGVVWFFCILMGVSGGAMLLGSTVFDMPGNVYSVFLLLHDLGFFLFCVFGLAHIFLGSGIFQPYRGMARIMWGDGNVTESDALYHWGHWARKVLKEGDKVIDNSPEAAAADE